jgi:hypothetical protein
MMTLTHANISVGAAGEENSLIDSQKSTASMTLPFMRGSRCLIILHRVKRVIYHVFAVDRCKKIVRYA